ncbi:MAG: ABC transporter substrate-binding protein [Acidobacteriota bacterium]
MIGTKLAGRYELVGELGRGGMAVVYRAKDPRLGRDVAVKMIPTEGLDETGVERFQREAQLVAGLDHPSIVPIFDFGSHGGWMFFVMPVLRGETLHRLLRGRSLGLEAILEVLIQAAGALHYSHDQGVVHRDVKPENVMVSLHERRVQRVWVMDFGLALARATPRLTQSGNLPGTLAYLSPEQVLGLDLDGRSDIYSLGVILYECLAGHTPFAGQTARVLHQIVHDPPSPRGLEAAAGGLKRLVGRCLAKRPDERPSSGQDMAEELREHLRQLRSGAASVTLGAAVDGVGPPLAGRSVEMAQLRERLRAAQGGECQMVLLGGEEGMGKTRLLQELGDEARGQGAAVLWGRFGEREGSLPLGAFGELIADHFRQRTGRSGTGERGVSGTEETPSRPTSGTPSSGAAFAASGGVPDLSDLGPELLALFPALGEFPELGDPEPPSEVPTQAEANYELVARTLVRLGAGRPLVLMIEHLHRADASIPLLRYLVRRLGPTPTLIVATFRTSEVGRHHPLTRLRRSVEEDARCQYLDLPPLAENEHRRMVSDLLGGGEVAEEAANRLYEATEGNPFFTEELVRNLVESGTLTMDRRRVATLSADGVAPQDLPPTIQDAVEGRLARLDEGPLRVLSTASVLGRRFQMRSLEALWGEALDEVEDAVDVLIDKGLLLEERRGRGESLRFSSSLVCDVVYRALPRRRRRTLHRRVAERLEGRFEGRLERVYPELLHHFSEAEVSEKAVDYGLRLARQSIAACGWGTAIQAARTALDMIEDDTLAAAESEAKLRLALAEALRATGAIDVAMREGRRAVQIIESVDPAQAAAAAGMLAQTAWQARRVDEAQSWLERGLALARRGDAKEPWVDLLTLAATLANLRGDRVRARGYLDDADQLRRRLEGAAAGPEVLSGGVLRLGMARRLTTREPAATYTVQDAEVLFNVFEPLIDIDGDGHPSPRLAEAFRASGDGLGYHVTLRPDLAFACGTPVTASTVKGSLEEAARMGRGRLDGAVEPLLGYRSFLDGAADDIEGIVVVSELEIRLRLASPLAIFPALLASTPIALRRSSDRFGTGPFRQAGRVGDGVLLEPNPRFRNRDAVALDRVEVHLYDGAQEIAEALRHGELDLVRDLAPADVEDFLRADPFRGQVFEITQQNSVFLIWNGGGPRSRNADLRRILGGVIDGRRMVWRLFARFAVPATGILPPGTLGHDPDREREILDRLEAVAAMQDFTPLPVRLKGLVHSQFLDQYKLVTDALLAQWSLLGVEVDLEELPQAGTAERLERCEDVDFVITRWFQDYPDPDSFTYGPFHSRVGIYRRLLADAGLDDLLEQGRREGDRRRRIHLYRRIEDELVFGHRILPLFHDVDYRVASTQVSGIRLLERPPYLDYGALGLLTEGSTPVAAPPRSGRLHIPLRERFDSLDPAQSYLAEVADAVANVFEPLMRLDEGANLVPHLAESVRSEEGGRRYVFRLRDVRFHDGRKVTPRDVRYSFERMLRSSAQSELEAVNLPIVGAEEVVLGRRDDLEGFEILSDREFVLHLDQPLAILPALLTNPATAVVPEGSERFVGTWREGCTGTGPFCLVGFEIGQRFELAANPSYWRQDLPRCERLVFDFQIPPEVAADEFRAGRYSLLADPHPKALEELIQDAEVAAGLREHPAFSTYFLTLNRYRGAFADPEVRRRFVRNAAGIRRLLAGPLGRAGVVAHGLIPPGLVGPAPDRYLDPPDIHGRPLRGLRLAVGVHPQLIGRFGTVWNHFVGSLEQLGAELEVVCTSSQDLLAVAASGEVDLLAARWIAAYPDADTFANVFHSVEGLAGRLAGHDGVDRLVEQARAETDSAVRNSLYNRFEQQLADDAIMVPLFHEQMCRLAAPGVEGLRLRYGWPEVAYEDLTARG